MNNRTRLTILGIVLLLLPAVPATTYAQRNFYYRVELGSMNAYTALGTAFLAFGTNYLTNRTLLEVNYGGPLPSFSDDYSVSFDIENMLACVNGGLKLGYQSDEGEKFNYGVYGFAGARSLGYELHTYNYHDKERANYLSFGPGAFLVYGGIESKLLFQFETSLRYNQPLSYSGLFDGESPLNGGLSTYFAIKCGGFIDFNIGLFYELHNYDMYKSDYIPAPNKCGFWGLIFTYTPRNFDNKWK